MLTELFVIQSFASPDRSDRTPQNGDTHALEAKVSWKAPAGFEAAIQPAIDPAPLSELGTNGVPTYVLVR